MAKNCMDAVAKMLGVELGEEFIIENAEHKETVVLAADGFHVIQPNDVLGPNNGNLLSKVLLGLFEVKKKPWEPKEGEIYYYPAVYSRKALRVTWHSNMQDYAMKALGMVYRTKGEAEAHFAEDYERLTGKKLEG